MDFQDIKIIGIDEAASKRAGKGGELFDLVLKLSASAPSEWCDYFDGRWKQEIYMMKRNAYASGNRITITCVPTELEKDHLPQLSGVIEATNAAYRTYIVKRESEEAKKKELEAEDKATIGNLNNQLFKQ